MPVLLPKISVRCAKKYPFEFVIFCQPEKAALPPDLEWREDGE